MPAPATSLAIREALARKALASARQRTALGRLLNLADNEILAIQHLSRAGRLTPSRLGWLLGLTSGGTTALVQRLEREGHVVREPHPADRRSWLLRLTPAIERRAAESLAPLVEAVDAIVAALPEDDRRTVSAFLDDVAAASERSADDLTHAANDGARLTHGLPVPGLWV